MELKSENMSWNMNRNMRDNNISYSGKKKKWNNRRNV